MNKLDLEETTRRFHDIYEQVAKEYGYKTRKDTKELDFNSPNGMTMLKTVEMITTPYLEEIERLNNIIDRAIEYLKDNACYNDMGNFNDDLDYDKCGDLLDILKGSDKE